MTESYSYDMRRCEFEHLFRHKLVPRYGRVIAAQALAEVEKTIPDGDGYYARVFGAVIKALGEAPAMFSSLSASDQQCIADLHSRMWGRWLERAAPSRHSGTATDADHELGRIP